MLHAQHVHGANSSTCSHLHSVRRTVIHELYAGDGRPGPDAQPPGAGEHTPWVHSTLRCIVTLGSGRVDRLLVAIREGAPGVSLPAML